MTQPNKKALRSVVREVGMRENRAFSSFPDLLQKRIDKGEVSSLQDLIDNRPELLGGILFEWYRQGQIACVFAQRLAKKPTEAKWQSITVKGRIDVDQLNQFLEEASSTLEGVQIVFAERSTVTDAVEIITQLAASSMWSVTELDWMPDEEGRSVQIGLRWRPSSNAYTSWLLGIAPFASMPFTRRFVNAPFIALVLRPSPPTEFVPTPIDENGLPAAHLAHMNDGLGDDERVRDDSNAVTKRAKIALLGSELRSTARAKVTFSLPLWAREVLYERSILKRPPSDESAAAAAPS